MAIVEFGYGFWNPIIWVVAFALVMIIAYFFSNQGQKKYKKDTAQTQIFLCGEEVPEPEKRNVKANNVYWGFLEALKGYYDTIVRPHTGIVNDYIVWFIVILAINAIVVFIVGLV